MEQTHPPGTPSNLECIRCGAPAKSAEYVWLARMRRGVLAVSPPISTHLTPKPGRSFEWMGLCARHRRRRMLAAMAACLLAYGLGITLFVVTARVVDLRSRVLGLMLIGGAFLFFLLGPLAALWKLTVLPVPSGRERSVLASRGGAGHFPVESETRR